MIENNTISIIIPVYNPTSYLVILCRSISEILITMNMAHEIILIDDSDDVAAWKIVREITDVLPKTSACRLSRNVGQHAALIAGVRQATGDVLITIDDDGQHSPNEIPILLEALKDDVDVVYGFPSRGVHGGLRGIAALSSKLLLAAVTGVPEMRHMSAFRAFRSEVIRSTADACGDDLNIDVLLSWSTRRFRAIESRHQVRKSGRSGYNARRLFRHLLNLYIGYTIWPLRIASVTGLCASFLGLTVLCYVVVVYMLNPAPVPGFAFIASTVAFFAGAQLLALGIIGEYLARIHVRSMGRPTYVVREVVGARGEASGLDHGEALGGADR